MSAPPLAPLTHQSALTERGYRELMPELYRRQQKLSPKNDYLADHSRNKVIAEQVSSFL